MRMPIPALVLSLALTLAAPAAGQRVLGGLHVGGPVRLSAAVALHVGDPFGGDARDGRGVILLAEPGWRGQRAGVGYVFLAGSLGTFLSARASALLLHQDAGTTRHVGIDVQYLPLFALGARVGAYAPTSRAHGAKPMLIADLSIGL